MNYATAQLSAEEGLPLCNRLLREAHRVLLTGARGGDMQPGEFRRSQNWIGGTRPGNAAFVPPSSGRGGGRPCRTLSGFVHASGDGLPALVRAGLAHVQFETIHPFLDGNGRTGRMLIILMLIDRQLLSSPVLYLSLHFKQHRDRYYELLDAVRRTGDWETWLEFFLEGVGAVGQLRSRDRPAPDGPWPRRTGRGLRPAGRGANSLLRVHEALTEGVIVNVAEVVNRTGLSAPTVGNAA